MFNIVIWDNEAIIMHFKISFISYSIYITIVNHQKGAQNQ